MRSPGEGAAPPSARLGPVSEQRPYPPRRAASGGYSVTSRPARASRSRPARASDH